MTREEAIKIIRDNIPHLGIGATKMTEALESLIPELRESEDERIRKWIVEELEITRDAMSGKNDYSDDPDIIARLKRLDEALAWLEKQKEQPKEELVYRLNGLMQDYIKEGKDDEEKEHRLKCYRLFWDALEDTSYFEQKESLGDFIDDFPYSDEQKEQKPAEWSEEDEKNLELVTDCVYEFYPDPVMKYKLKDWLTQRLKSLRPQPQKLEDWTEEDERLLGDVLGCITLVQTYKACGDLKDFKTEYTGEELRSFVRSLKSRPRKQPHWKPSKEQIGALEVIVKYGDKESTHIKSLRELYEQLKKLM